MIWSFTRCVPQCAQMPTSAASPKKNASFSWFKFARWTFLAVLVIVVLVMLKKPVPPANFSHITPEQATASAASFDEKLNDLERARAAGTSAEVRLTTDELNSAFQRSQGELPQLPARLSRAALRPRLLLRPRNHRRMRHLRLSPCSSQWSATRS